MSQQQAPGGMDPVVINHALSSRIRTRSMYFELGFSSRPEIYTRASVRQRLLQALDHLPAQVGFMVWDVYRPRAVQAKLFAWMQGELSKQHPTWSEEAILQETKKYAAVPSVVGESYCPPHLSGGAVDLTLFDCGSGEVLNMGTPFDDCTERAHALYFENQTTLSAQDETYRASRALLRNAMLSAGFVMYDYEWWHFDYGDCLWAKKTDQPALFGPLFGDLEWPDHLMS